MAGGEGYVATRTQRSLARSGISTQPVILDRAPTHLGKIHPGVCGDALALPFQDNSFDAVCEFSTLHHVLNPSPVVGEMLRVARKVVLIADSNRFGQGSKIARLIKFALYKTGLWPAYWSFRTRGKGYIVDEGDGLAYSYSVYDSYDQVAEWADRIVLVPANRGSAPSWFHPLLNRDAILLFAFKEAD